MSENIRGRDQSGNPRYVFIREEQLQQTICPLCQELHWIVERVYQDKKLSTDTQDYIINTSVLTGCCEYDPFRDRNYQAVMPNVSRGIKN